MGSLKRYCRRGFVGATVVFLTVALVEFTIPQLGFFWHLLHTSRVTIGKYSFTVPPKYFLKSSEGRLTFLRLSPALPLISEKSISTGPFAKQSIIGIYEHEEVQERPNSDDAYIRLKELLTNDAKRDGFTFQSERTLTTKVGPVYCLQFDDSEAAEVRCFLDQGRIRLFFDGERRFADDLYLVLSGIEKN